MYERKDIFFFKQKTTYEMRISDWSSDVCSSDLLRAEKLGARGPHADVRVTLARGFVVVAPGAILRHGPARVQFGLAVGQHGLHKLEFAYGPAELAALPGISHGFVEQPQLGRASWRERGWHYV